MSTEEDFKKQEKKAYRLAIILFSLLFVFLAGTYLHSIITPYFLGNQSHTSHLVEAPIDTGIKNGIHMRTGLIDAQGLMTVVNNCTSCHSSKIILQNRMDAESWNTTIKWMQETQNLWDLGKNQEIIVSYLTTNYPIEDKGRRENLLDIYWYELEN